MRRTICAAVLVTLALATSSGLVIAQQTGSAADAKAMFDRAITALKANEAAALTHLTTRTTNNITTAIFTFSANMSDGKFTAHSNPAIMGTDVRALKIRDDPIGQRSFDGVKNAPEGTVSTFDYEFPSARPSRSQSNPLRRELATKRAALGYYK